MKKIVVIAMVLSFNIAAFSQTYDINGDYKINGKLGIGTETPEESIHSKGAAYFHFTTGGIKIDNVFNTQENGYVRSSIISSRDGDLEWNQTSKLWTLGSSSSYNDFACILHTYNGELSFFTGKENAFTSLSNTEFRDQFQRMTIANNGYVGIGTRNPQSLLAVNGIITTKEVVVTIDGWSDFVFNKDYKLKDLEEVENFIEENNHLPDIPSEKEVMENGIQVGEMNAKLLQKIEELTLYMIEQNKKTEILIEKVETLEFENKELKEKVTTLETVE